MNEEQFKRIEELLQTLVKINLKGILESELEDPKMKKLYDLTGQHKVNEISKRVGFSTGKISQIWQKWESMGLLKRQGKLYKKII